MYFCNNNFLYKLCPILVFTIASFSSTLTFLFSNSLSIFSISFISFLRLYKSTKSNDLSLLLYCSYPYISIKHNNDSWLVDPINNKVVFHNKYYGDNSEVYKDKDFLIYWLGDSPVKYTIYTKDIIKIIDKADTCYYSELEKVLYCLKDNKI